MNKKDRFLGNPLNKEIAETIKNGQEQIGDLNVEHIPLNRIDVDIENPRRTGFTNENILDFDEANNNDPNKKRIWEGLQSLAVSIQSIGVQQAIKVYRYRDRFRIAFGERRYLASLIANKETIPAWILHEKPINLRAIQYVENMQREDLTTWERIQNVQGIISESEPKEGGRISITYLTELSGMSRSRASHYLSILSGPDDVKELIRSGLVNNLEKGGYLSRIEDDNKRKMAIKMLLNGDNTKEIDKLIYQDEQEKKGIKTLNDIQIKKGRPRTSISLGETTKIEIIRRIMTIVIPKEHDLLDHNNVDWDDIKSVSRHWKLFLKALEMEIEQLDD
jgi:ParB family transcriptional regulator, chromosome partitioning protein